MGANVINKQDTSINCIVREKKFGFDDIFRQYDNFGNIVYY